MKQFLYSLMIQTIIWFIVLFDVDGAQLGISLFDNVPLFVITIAGILGNLLWVLGVLFLLTALVLIIMMNTDGAMEKTGRELTPKKRKSIVGSKSNIISRTIVTITAIFATGSGFWFYGPSSIVMMIVFFFWRKMLMKVIQDKDKEDGVVTTDDLKKALLDD